jgi:NAD(P)-dependent dehydrogenase (short-subunit alcohol dehydrogenase family)
MRNAILAGNESGVGKWIKDFLIKENWNVITTSRKESALNEQTFFCDFSSGQSVDKSTGQILETMEDWDLLIISIGVLNPIGPIKDLDLNVWVDSINVNFINQIRFIVNMLNTSLKKSGRTVLTFAGGGTNSATPNFFAYTVSKIALLKATELLAYENPDTKFISIGTGWMNTPIHDQTLKSDKIANSETFLETMRRISEKDFVEPITLIQFIKWTLSQPIEMVSGRNFSINNDPWENEIYITKILSDPNSYKLRRFNNDK